MPRSGLPGSARPPPGARRVHRPRVDRRRSHPCFRRRRSPAPGRCGCRRRGRCRTRGSCRTRSEPPSSRHSKVEPPSVDVKLKSALEEPLGSARAGRDRRVGRGRVHRPRVGLRSGLGVARRRRSPGRRRCGRPRRGTSSSSGSSTPRTSLRRAGTGRRRRASLALKSKLAPVALVGSAGAESIDVTGRVRSTVTFTMSSPVFEPTSRGDGAERRVPVGRERPGGGVRRRRRRCRGRPSCRSSSRCSRRCRRRTRRRRRRRRGSSL